MIEKTSPHAASQSGKSVLRKPIRGKPPSTGKWWRIRGWRTNYQFREVTCRGFHRGLWLERADPRSDHWGGVPVHPPDVSCKVKYNSIDLDFSFIKNQKNPNPYWCFLIPFCLVNNFTLFISHFLSSFPGMSIKSVYFRLQNKVMPAS